MPGRHVFVVAAASILAGCFFDEKTLAPADAAVQCSAAQPYSSCVLESAPVLYFRFEEPGVANACDELAPSCLSYGQGGGTVEPAPGLILESPDVPDGTARSFIDSHGYSNEVDVGIAARLAGVIDDSTQWTVEFWHRRESGAPQGWPLWLRPRDGAPEDVPKLQILAEGDGFHVEFRPLTTTVWFIDYASEAALTEHIVLRFDGEALTVHVNGAEPQRVEAPISADGGTQMGDPVLALGGSSANATAPFTGTLDEVAIYGKALGDDEIAAHHQRGIGQAP